MGRLTAPRVLFAGTALALAAACVAAAEAPPADREPSGSGRGAAVVPEETHGEPREELDKEPHEELHDEPLDEADVRGIKALLGRLAAAMMAGDAEAIGELFSPALSPDERDRVVSRARGEFDRMRYHRFTFEPGDSPVVDRLGPDQIEMVVPATYEYETRTEGQSQIAGEGETAYPFRLVRADGRWWIVWSELIEQFAPKSIEQVLGWVFLGIFVTALAVFFWGWMSLDAWARTGRPGYSLAIVLTPPVGAIIYFFAVYLRGKFIRRERV